MTAGRIIFLAGLIVAAICVTASAAAKRPGDTWHYYHFDGRAFIAGQAPDSAPFIALREQMKPAVVTQPSPIEAVALPPGKGVAAGICYIQSTGGKLSHVSRYEPVPRTPVRISSGGRMVVTIEADDHGYFMVVLAAGMYTIGSGPFTAEIEVKRGITTLVPLRVGKRVVD